MNETFDFEAWRLSLSHSLSDLQTSAAAYLPKIVVAAVILVMGWLVSKLLELVARALFSRLGVDRVSERFGLASSLGQAGVATPLSTIFAKTLFWLVLLAFVFSAVHTLGITALEPALDRLITLLPNLVAALLIFVAGLLAARFSRNLVDSGAATMNLAGARWLGSTVYVFVLVLAIIIALEQLGVETAVLIAAITALVATMGVTAGIALALGSRGVIEHILAGHYLRQSLTIGQHAQIGSRKGILEQVGPVSTVFRDGDEAWSIPNRQLLNEIITH